MNVLTLPRRSGRFAGGLWGLTRSVLARLSALGLSEQMFVGHFYRLFAQGQFSLLDLLGPNAESLAAIQELEEGRGVVSASVDDLFADLHAID